MRKDGLSWKQGKNCCLRFGRHEPVSQTFHMFHNVAKVTKSYGNLRCIEALPFQHIKCIIKTCKRIISTKTSSTFIETVCSIHSPHVVVNPTLVNETDVKTFGLSVTAFGFLYMFLKKTCGALSSGTADDRKALQRYIRENVFESNIYLTVIHFTVDKLWTIIRSKIKRSSALMMLGNCDFAINSLHGNIQISNRLLSGLAETSFSPSISKILNLILEIAENGTWWFSRISLLFFLHISAVGEYSN